MTKKSSTLNYLKGSLRTLLCQSCSTVATRYVVHDRRLYDWIGDDEFISIGCQYSIATIFLSAAVWP